MRASGLAITGLGIVSAIGHGKEAFFERLVRGEHAFAHLKRPGRTVDEPASGPGFIGAELPGMTLPGDIPLKSVRAASLSAQAALACVHEAYHEARLAEVDPRRIGLLVGGSNFQQRELVQIYKGFEKRRQFLRPSYALSFLDTDICGFCTEQLPIQGFAFTLGGAAASGQAAIIQGAQAILSGQVDVCIAVGALMDLSAWECQALRASGAMGSERFADQPAQACRPFDRDRDGFIFGEASGAVVIEDVARTGRQLEPYASLVGWAVGMDRNRSADPSVAGERHVIESALRMAGLAPGAIEYVNPHGSGSVLGDKIELLALVECGLAGAAINTTKSITGHGFCAAGVVEVIATALQMRRQVLHPCRNLENPIDPRFDWLLAPQPRSVKSAVSVSIGFGGLSTAVCLQKE